MRRTTSSLIARCHRQVYGDAVISRARAVMVAFDARTQRAAQLSERQREVLLGPVP